MANALFADDTSYALAKHVYFVGYMGAGKSTVAQRLADILSLPLVDVDTYLEQREGRPIARIFAEEGERFFRDVEESCLNELACAAPQIISCGGGVVTRDANIEVMRNTGYVVYLKVTPEEALARIPNTANRPLLTTLEQAQKTIRQRKPLYDAAAHAFINTTERSVQDVVADVLEVLRNAGVLVDQRRSHR